MRRLATFIAPYWAHLASGLISLILLTGTQLFIPRYAGVTVDEIIRTGSMAVVNRAALVALAVLGLRSYVLYGQFYSGLFFGHRVIADIRRLVFQRVQRWSLDRFAGWTSSDLITRSLQDTQVVQGALLVGLLDFIGTALTVAGITVMLFVLEWRPAVFTLVVIPLLLTAARLFGHEIQHVSQRAQERIAKGWARWTVYWRCCGCPKASVTSREPWTRRRSAASSGSKTFHLAMTARHRFCGASRSVWKQVSGWQSSAPADQGSLPWST